jgi:hypothetical protein
VVQWEKGGPYFWYGMEYGNVTEGATGCAQKHKDVCPSSCYAATAGIVGVAAVRGLRSQRGLTLYLHTVRRPRDFARTTMSASGSRLTSPRGR